MSMACDFYLAQILLSLHYTALLPLDSESLSDCILTAEHSGTYRTELEPWLSPPVLAVTLG